MPKTNITNYTHAYWNQSSILSQYNVHVSGVTALGQSPEHNKFYKKLSSYKSLNILIPVALGSDLEAKHLALKKESLYDMASIETDYYDAILDRKYFLREVGTGKKYFKLPILTFYGNKSAMDSIGDTQADKSRAHIFDKFEEELNAPMFPEDSNSITIYQHLQSVFEQESAAKKILYDKLVDLDKEIVTHAGFKSDTAAYGKKYPGSYGNDKFNALSGQLMHKDKRGIWGIINSRPVGDSKKASIYPESHSKIPNQPVVRQYINIETGEKWNEAGWKKSVQPHPVNTAAYLWRGNTKYWDKEKESHGWKHWYSNKTNMAVPSLTGDSVAEEGHSYWNGKYWLSVEANHFAEKLQEIWGILHKFNATSTSEEYATGANQEKYYWSQAAQNLSKAYEKLALLEQLRDMKITAQLDTKMSTAILPPGDSGYANKEYPMFLDIDSPNEGGVNELTSGGWVHNDGNPRGVQWTKRSKIQEMINLYSNKTTKEDENGKIIHHWFGLAGDEWKYKKDIKNVEVLMSQALFDALIPTMANDPRFKAFTQSIQYKSLLSFLSILVAETVESEYGQLKTMFNGTLNTIQTALNTFATTANRSKDPEFYQKTGQAPGEDPAPIEIL